MSALWEIQKAVYTTLASSPELTSKVKGIYDEVPENAQFPYITVGDAIEKGRGSFTSKYYEAYITCHIWSRYKGFKEALEILAIMNSILDNKELVISGFNHVYTYLDFAETLRDPDGITRHVPVRYKIFVEKL